MSAVIRPVMWSTTAVLDMAVKEKKQKLLQREVDIDRPTAELSSGFLIKFLSPNQIAQTSSTRLLPTFVVSFAPGGNLFSCKDECSSKVSWISICPALSLWQWRKKDPFFDLPKGHVALFFPSRLTLFSAEI
jgi:hypothetical protein